MNIPCNSITVSLIKRASRKTIVSVSSAIAASIMFYVLLKRATSPPKKLRHIPHVSYLQMMKAYFLREPLLETSRRLIAPVIATNPNGLYLRPSRKIWNVYVTDPAIAKTVCNKIELFPKLDLTAANEGTFNGKFQVRSNNIFFSTGEKWKRQRQIANPAFHKAMPISLFGLYTKKLLDNLAEASVEEDNVIDISKSIRELTLDILGDAGFDFKFNSLDHSGNEYVNRYERVMDALIDPLFFFFPAFDKEYRWLFPRRQEAHKELDIFLDMIRDIIASKRATLNSSQENESFAESSTTKDILTLLLESAQIDENKSISITDDDMLLSNMCILFTAGHDTTTATILFLIYELAMNEDIQARARNEITSILGDDDIDVIPTDEQLEQMDYLNMVIKETLRLHPPAPISSPRIATEECILGDQCIPKGSTIVLDLMNLHRNPKYWNSPDTFDPDRFRSGGEADRHAGLGTTYAPFGGGARLCVGKKFAMNELKVVMSMFLKKYVWKLPSNSIHRDGLVTKGIFLLSVADMKVSLESRY